MFAPTLWTPPWYATIPDGCVYLLHDLYPPNTSSLPPSKTNTHTQHVILVPHKCMMTIPTPPVKTTPGTLPYPTVVPFLLII